MKTTRLCGWEYAPFHITRFDKIRQWFFLTKGMKIFPQKNAPPGKAQVRRGKREKLT